jgi:hypothetical protein
MDDDEMDDDEMDVQMIAVALALAAGDESDD